MVKHVTNGGRVSPNPGKSKLIRKTIKKENLKEAKSHFPYKVKLESIGCSVFDAQTWLTENRYRSWKKKGIAADFYYDKWSILFFASKDVMTHFILSLSK